MKTETIMPPQISGEYKVIHQQVLLLHAKWKIFTQLYLKSEERITLMNDIAPTFFGIIQRMFVDDLILGVSRLLDPAKTNKKNENISLARLMDSIRIAGRDSLCDSLAIKMDSLKENENSVRSARDKRVSHNDYTTLLNEKANALPDITREQIDAMLTCLHEFLDEIAVNFGDSPSFWNMPIPGDGDSVIHFLKLAKAYRNRCENLEIDPSEDGLTL
jgi:hypothetical protein